MPTKDESDETMEECCCPFCKSKDVVWLGVESDSSFGQPGVGPKSGPYRCLRAGCGKEFNLPLLSG